MTEDPFAKQEKYHEEWIKFRNYFKEWYHDDKEQFSAEKMAGRNCVKRVMQYAKENPLIKVIPVMDSTYGDSILIVIPHLDVAVTCIYVTMYVSEKNQFMMPTFTVEHLTKELSASIANKKVRHMGKCMVCNRVFEISKSEYESLYSVKCPYCQEDNDFSDDDFNTWDDIR